MMVVSLFDKNISICSRNHIFGEATFLVISILAFSPRPTLPLPFFISEYLLSWALDFLDGGMGGGGLFCPIFPKTA